jgi:large subunit ribosomal protein L25
MDRVQMSAQVRREVGKGPARRVRREGLIPAVVYGPRTTPLPISLDLREVKQVLASGENVLVDLKIQGGKKKRDNRLVMVKSFDVHPVTDRLRHVDLYEVSLEETIRVEVPINLTGDAQGVKMGGILSPLIRALEISCLPEQIPEHIEVDCSALDIGDTIHVSDLSIPEEIQVLTDLSTAVVTVSPPEAEEVAVAVEAEEEAAAEEEEVKGPSEEAEEE